MHADNQQNQELIKDSNDLESKNLIPPQYQGLPSEIVEELWTNPIYVDEARNNDEAKRRKDAIMAIKKEEIDREEEKQKIFESSYQNLSAEQKADFPKYKEQAVEIFNEYIRDGQDIENLSGEEVYVLQKIKSAYEKFKEDKPDEQFHPDFLSDLDKRVYNNLIQKLSLRVLGENQVIKDVEKANSVRESIGLPKIESKVDNQNWEQISENDYKEFKVKSGDTDIGVFWHEYRNTAAKKLEGQGKFKWGKERIYFDIPIDKMDQLRDLALMVANEEQIPVAFKYLDTKKTYSVNLKSDSDTTRFVANFASISDAKKFYDALYRKDEYRQMKSDRNMDYQGFNIDNVAHYASGYRESREALKRIVDAKMRPDGFYSYFMGDREIKLSQDEYNSFKAKFNSMPNLDEAWKNASNT